MLESHFFVYRISSCARIGTWNAPFVRKFAILKRCWKISSMMGTRVDTCQSSQLWRASKMADSFADDSPLGWLLITIPIFQTTTKKWKFVTNRNWAMIWMPAQTRKKSAPLFPIYSWPTGGYRRRKSAIGNQTKKKWWKGWIVSPHGFGISLFTENRNGRKGKRETDNTHTQTPKKRTTRSFLSVKYFSRLKW